MQTFTCWCGISRVGRSGCGGLAVGGIGRLCWWLGRHGSWLGGCHRGILTVGASGRLLAIGRLWWLTVVVGWWYLCRENGGNAWTHDSVGEAHGSMEKKSAGEDIQIFVQEEYRNFQTKC